VTPTQKRFNRAWIKRLRSGKDRQGRGVLRNKNGSMCCLGVASEMQRIPRRPHLIFDRYIYNYDGTTGEAFPSVSWLEETTGLGQGIGLVLAAMNDSGSTFNDIADFIEKEVNKNSPAP
jgi:hypothetical protein